MILTMNNFSFDGKHYVQIHGTAMGIGMAPLYACFKTRKPHIIMVALHGRHLYVNNIALSPLAIERKLANLKTNKATGPDDISPKILKEAGDALLTPLMYPYTVTEIDFIKRVDKGPITTVKVLES